MTKFSWLSRGWQLKLFGSVAIVGTLFAAVGESVLAQIVPDNTLGAEGSVVTPNVNIQRVPSDQIDGGATRGANLFHSFWEFNVGEGRGAYFANPTGIENILTRVTGNNPSNIFGRLGVLGEANLFLLNPNGIVFGPNASLDIQGSFVATTAERIQLGDSGYFSAAQPQTSSLLSVSPGALFFSQVTNQPGSIINQGNLSTGKHLTLRAGNLDLQGQLLSGGDLTLQAQDTVKVRDTVATPFLARTGGNITIIGNGGIDILALNHPTRTPFVSGGNLSLISDGVISGDARFSSGGSFSIKSVSGGLANFFSYYDPIISAEGDVDVVANYTGTSLLVEATGNIRFQGDINITGPDTSTLPPGPDTDTLSTSSALIMRSGQSTSAYGGVNSGAVPTASNGPVPAGITLGGKVTLQPFNGSGGIVMLTAASGNVSTQRITTNGGAIDIKSAGGITTNRQTIDAKNGVNDGGEIRLEASNGSINTGNLLSDSYSFDTAGNGGAISLEASNGSISTGNVNSSSYSDNGIAGNGGTIRFFANNGNIQTGFLASNSRSNAAGSGGNGGDISLFATDNINVNSALYSYSSNRDTAGNGGAIGLTAANDILIDSGLYSYSQSDLGDAGQGGAINLTAANNIFIDGGLASYSRSFSGDAGQGGAINLTAANDIFITGNLSSASRSFPGDAGQGGAINLTAANNIFIDGGLYSYSLSTRGNAGQGGAINLTAANDILIDSGLYSYSQSDLGDAGQGGAINLTAANNIFITGNLSSASRSTRGNAGQGGAIALTAQNNITTGDLYSYSRSTRGNAGQGGAINLTAANNIFITGDLYSYSRSTRGNAGQGGAIALTAQNNITTGNLESYSDSRSGSAADGGEIVLTANGNISTGFLSSGSNQGNGGAIAITAGGDFTTFGLSSGSNQGNGGAIAITAGDNIISTRYLASNSSKGNGGAIAVTAGGNFSAYGLESNSVQGNGGEIAVTADGDITLRYRDAAVSISNGRGNGGAIALRAGGNITASDFLSYSGTGNGGAIALAASGDVTTGNLVSDSKEGNGGAVTINSTNGRIVLQSGRYGQSLIDTEGVNGGNVTLSSPNQGFVFENPSDDLSRPSGIYSAASNGNGGNIQITAPSVTLSDVELNTSARGRGDAGSISILADGLVALDGSRLFTSLEPGGLGRGGDITIDAGAVSLSNASFIDTATFGQGNAGNILLEVDDSISLANDSAIFSFTAGQGNGGHVKLEAGGAVSLTNRSNISTAVNSRAQGDGGDIEIRARSLSLTGGSQLITSTSSSGKAGDITVTTIEGVFISGTDPNFIPPKNVLVGNPPPLAEVEPNDSLAQAQPLTQFFLNSPDDVNPKVERSTQNPYVFFSGTRLSSDDNDFYSFEVTAPGTRGIFRFNAPDAPGYIRLYNGSKNLLVLSSRVGPDDRAGFDNSVISYVFSEPGIYYVNPERSSQGDYTFQVSLETPNAATSVVNGTLPSGLFARTEGAGTAGNITINTPLLTVTDGGNVSATATAAATSTARGGNIELNTSQINLQGNNSGIFAQTEGAASAGSLRLQPSNNGQSLTVNLQDNAQISASTSGSGRGGNLFVTAPQAVTINGDGKLSVETTGAGQAGDVTITTDTLKIDNGAKVSATATATATTNEPGGSVNVNASQINLSGNTSGLFAQTQGAAPAGSLTLKPFNNGQTLSVNLQDNPQISASTSDSGEGGSLRVTAPEAVTIRGLGQLSVETTGAGKAGGLTIETQKLNISDGATVSASTSSPYASGTGGNLSINATQSFNLTNQARLLAQSNGAAPAGNVAINTEQLTANNGSITTSATARSSGRGGSIDVNASQINLKGTEIGLLAETQGVAPAGSLTLQPFNNGQDLTINLQDNAKISAATSGSGQGGSLRVTVPEAITIRGLGQLSVETTGDGAAGNLTIDTQRLTIADGATISASTFSPNPDGFGGNLTINATESFNLTNQASLLAQSTGAAPAGNITIDTGQLTANNGSIETSATQSRGGAITITASDIRLFGDSDIRTDVAKGAGGGGNINLTANTIIAFDDSDILAYAADGKGGDITFKTPIFFGFAYSPAPKGTDPDTLENNNQVDINATGAVEGVITIPDVSFIQNSLTELPDNQIDTDSLLANSCIVRRNQPTRGSFTITGTGGLPQRPGDAQMSSYPTVDVETLPSDSTATNTNPNRPWQKGDPIVEPQGVYRLPNGKFVMSRECPQ